MAGSTEPTNDSMVDALVESGYVESPDVERAMRDVDRAEFVDASPSLAYRDAPLSIGEGQTVSAPHMVAMMTERLEVERGHRVLEVGTGSGYHAAVVAAIAGADNVYTVEYHRGLAAEARDSLRRAGYGDVTVVVGDGSRGYEAAAPYDRVYLTCAAPEIPGFLEGQLRDGGRAVLPVGRGAQTLYVVERHGDDLETEADVGVRFVPLVGEEGV
ncbi:MAG: protein-L-isoaspartate(D-aspartate) O-methyltransferase [Halobacteriales archaeon]